MPTVTNTIKRPDGTAYSAGRVVIDLVGTNGTPIAGFVTASDYEIVSSHVVETLVAGVWSATLVANDLITPAGTRYRITEQVDGRNNVFYVEVPNGAGPYRVEDILDDAPGTIASSALTAHEDDASPHGVSFDAGNSGIAKTLDVENGDVQKLTLTAAVPALTLTVPTGERPKFLTLRVYQDGTGSRVPSWVNVLWPGGVAPAGSTGAGQEDMYEFLWDVGEAKWRGALAGLNWA